MEKCECYIHSLKQGDTHVLGEATILKRLGDNDYLAEYNGVKCHAIFNPFVGRYFVDDVLRRDAAITPDRGARITLSAGAGLIRVAPFARERRMYECQIIG